MALPQRHGNRDALAGVYRQRRDLAVVNSPLLTATSSLRCCSSSYSGASLLSDCRGHDNDGTTLLPGLKGSPTDRSNRT
jgi:hypothetical protein